MKRTDIFFYGLFMDADLLRAKGLAPADPEPARVDDVALRIGERATLVSAPGARVHGMVASMTLGDVERLYTDPSVQAYRPVAVLAHLRGGSTLAALSYVLPEPPAAGEHNPEYAAKLRALAERLGLPAAYVASIE